MFYGRASKPNKWPASQPSFLTGLEAKMARSYGDVAKTIKNRLRPYSLESILAVGLSLLRRRHKDPVVNLQMAPWNTALILKLVIEDRMINLGSGSECTEEVFDKCRDELWSEPALPQKEGGSIWLTLRAVMHAQIIFQQQLGYGYLRWPILIHRLPNEHRSKEQFRDCFGMEPAEFMLVISVFLGRIMSRDPVGYLDLSAYRTVSEGLRGLIEVFLERFVIDVTGLRKILRSDLQGRIEVGQPARQERERYEFPWLSRFPFVLVPGKRLVYWNKAMLFHGLSESVHNRMTDYGQEYTDSFSRVFEEYVHELLRDSGQRFISDDEFKAMFGNRSLAAVDAMIFDGGHNVFIEAKMSIFDDDVILSDSVTLAYSKLKRVRKAITQGWEVGSLIRRDGFLGLGQCTDSPDYLIVVTSRSLLLGNGRQLITFMGQDFFEKMLVAKYGAVCQEKIDNLPPENITVMSIEEFERLSAAVSDGVTTYLDFAQESARRAIDPQQATMVSGQIMDDQGLTRGSRILEAVFQEVVENARGSII